MDRSATVSLMRQWQSSIGELRDYAMIDDKATVLSVTLESGAHYILKQVGGIERSSYLESHYLVLLHLYKAHVPVAVPVPFDNRTFIVERDGRLYTLSPMLPNDDNDSMIRAPEPTYLNVGRAVGCLHRALATYPGEILSWHMDFAHRALSEAVPVIQANLEVGERTIFDAVLDDITQDMREVFSKLPAQYIHGDCHGGNIILHNGDVSGFVDFDLLPFGPRIYDVSYFLADRIKWLIETPVEAARWLKYFDHYIIGYEQIQPLTSREKAAIWNGMLAVQMIFAEWFFIHGDKAAASMNLAAFHWIYQHKTVIEASISVERKRA